MILRRMRVMLKVLHDEVRPVDAPLTAYLHVGP